MKIVTLAFLSVVGYAVSQKTVSIAAPNCNFDISIKAPTSKCCCPTTTPIAPTQPTTTVGTGNRAGCLELISYEPPKCSKVDDVKFPARECVSYYICTAGLLGSLNAKLHACASGLMFSYVQQKCVKSPTGCCPD